MLQVEIRRKNLTNILLTSSTFNLHIYHCHLVVVSIAIVKYYKVTNESLVDQESRSSIFIQCIDIDQWSSTWAKTPPNGRFYALRG